MCPDSQFEGDTFDDLSESHRSDICLSIFYCINWFRELVCSGCGLENWYVVGVVMRTGGCGLENWYVVGVVWRTGM